MGGDHETDKHAYVQVAPSWLRESLVEFAKDAQLDIGSLRISRIEFRYFSTILRADFRCVTSSAFKSFFIKMPRAVMNRNLRSIPAPTASDLTIASREYCAAEYLVERWNGMSTSFLRPVWWSERSGVLVYPWRNSQLVFEMLRASTTQDTDETVCEIIGHVGRDLARYHLRSLEWSDGPHERIAAKFRRFSADLEQTVGCHRLSDSLHGIVDSVLRTTEPIAFSPVIKGLDVRNIMYADEYGVELFDPGHISWHPTYTDIARFVVSCRMIWWGTRVFASDYRAADNAVTAFLSAYESELPIDQTLLRLFTLRELLKQWGMCQRVTKAKQYPRLVESVVNRVYVDRPFSRLVLGEMRHLEGDT